jgi:UDP-N-acetylglucosamine acyltransferase
MALGTPLSDLVGLNVIGMRRHGFTKSDIHRYRAAYRDLFFGEGDFRDRLDRVAAEHGGNPHIAKMLDFIRAGKRPLTMARKRNEAGAVDEDA